MNSPRALSRKAGRCEMTIAVIGIGYVGLVAAACFAEMGNAVVCVDSNASKIADLKSGRIPIHEPGLDEVVVRNLQEGRLAFTTSLEEAAESGIFFIAVGTPPSDDGSADLIQVLGVARQLGQVLRHYSIVVTNTGTTPISGLVVNDATPANTVSSNAASAFASQGSILVPANGTGGPVTATLGALASGASATIRFSVRINFP